ncbi:Transcriptional regulator, AraC family protein [Enhygromyxa salina]|uniref:Transcriptional regulator, AraC family protein n=1 Tax=Enhygromyxa salina TaxID=215803 RepID=A0A0C2CTP7_9BACT|nr:AraC family transcriptional regulator [Enhygromyxa salina]KIG12995.1 Transcriptional regulator, AraC family protein [Enhygromyxa salina]
MTPRLDLRAAFYGGAGFTLYHAWGPNSALPLSPHFHDEYLICAQLQGEEECQVSGKTERFSAGDVVLINPQQVHTGNQTGNAELEYLSLYVDRQVVERLAADLGAPTATPEFTVVKTGPQAELVARLVDLLGLVREHHGSRLYPHPATPADPEIELPAGPDPAAAPGPAEDLADGPAEDLADLHGHPSASAMAPDLSIDSALHDVVLLAFEEFSNLRQPMLRSTNRVGHRKIARSVEFIRNLETTEGAANVTLDELAEVAGLSKYHFLRQFSQVVGMTPGAYLRTLRLCHAARKLRTTELPILEVALSVGFADHPSFSRAFARHMGMTPSEYQKLGPI